jgi:Cd2+/Zn2+-exporting ATPase
MGIERTVMLTGDREAVARSIGDALGIDEVHAELMPDDKVRLVRELDERYGDVIMVGDGVNDAPAMVEATVGVAMGGAGTDVALETADIALMADDLANLPYAVALSRGSRRMIVQNLVISLGVIALLVPSALLGIAGIGIAIVLHESSTLVVVANALRLLGFRDRTAPSAT